MPSRSVILIAVLAVIMIALAARLVLLEYQRRQHGVATSQPAAANLFTPPPVLATPTPLTVPLPITVTPIVASASIASTAAPVPVMPASAPMPMDPNDFEEFLAAWQVLLAPSTDAGSVTWAKHVIQALSGYTLTPAQAAALQPYSMAQVVAKALN